jgi:hypothetical protein
MGDTQKRRRTWWATKILLPRPRLLHILLACFSLPLTMMVSRHHWCSDKAPPLLPTARPSPSCGQPASQQRTFLLRRCCWDLGMADCPSSVASEWTQQLATTRRSPTINSSSSTPTVVLFFLSWLPVGHPQPQPAGFTQIVPLSRQKPSFPFLKKQIY